MLHTWLLVAMVMAPGEYPECFEGVIGEGARQRRLIVQVQTDTSAVAHLYARPAREVPLVAVGGMKGRAYRSQDSTLTLTLEDDVARVTARLGGTEYEQRIARVNAQGTLAAPEVWTTTTGPGGVFRLVVRLGQGPCGTVIGEFDSPDQGQNALPVTQSRMASDSVVVEAAYMELRLAFPLSGGDERPGTLTQRGANTSIVLRRGAGLIRPQEPTRPYPYDERDVVFSSRAPGVRVTGTLTLPRSPGPHPAIVLISGSGAQDRDETIAGHRPFLVLSDQLTRAGYAVLRTDDRGTGGTNGQVLSSNIEDLAQDVRGAIGYLRSTPGIDAARIGLLGHSEGGYVAPVAAAADTGVAFLILLAAPAVSGRENLLSQRAVMSRASGMDTIHVRVDSAMLATILGALAARTGSDSVEGVVARALAHWTTGLPAPERTIASEILKRRTPEADAQSVRLWSSRWFDGILKHDPAPYLAGFNGPVLAIIGTLDIQVPSSGNVERFHDLFHGDRRRLLSLHTPGGVNHMLQPARTGRMDEYASIETTIDPGVLDAITSWLRQHVPPGTK